MAYHRLRRYLPVLLITLMILSGCQGGEVDPRPDSGGMSVRVNELDAESEEHRLRIKVDFEWYVENSTSFDGVMICAYDSNGTVLNSTDVGTFTPQNEERIVVLSADRRPHYVVVDHSELQDHGFTQIVLWNETANQYTLGRLSELPFEYPRERKSHACG